MQGTILIIDGVSTNRIMLKVQLSAAWYHVVQTDRLDGVRALLLRCRPDLVVTAMTLPDGNAADLRKIIASDPALSRIPVIAVTAQNDRTARLRALADGIDDVLSQPLDDVMLQARIRRLLRARSRLDDLQFDHADAGAGLREDPPGFLPAAPARRVLLLTETPSAGPLWRTQLAPLLDGTLECCPVRAVDSLMSQAAPDAVILELPGGSGSAGLRLLADIRARSSTQETIVIAVPNPADNALAAEALDRGAHDALPHGFCAEELVLRLSSQLSRKALGDRMRASLRTGLEAAKLDPMTGLYNRRYALPRLGRMVRRAQQAGQDFALMMVDLDHFKQINDRYGHLSGDAVLIETAHRMRDLIHPSAVIARVGGEEFLVGLPETDADAAVMIADRLCRRINDTPFHVPGCTAPIQVTTSIGIALGPEQSGNDTGNEIGGNIGSDDDLLAPMIGRADQALYRAKTAGRNQVTLARRAA